MSRTQVNDLIRQLHEAQRQTTQQILRITSYENLGAPAPEGFTVQELLRMWVWHFWSHYRELVRARGSLANDNPHFHVPHFVRQANEEFGRFVGELACLTDEQLVLTLPGDSRSIRQIVEHLLDSLTQYLPDQIAQACKQQEPTQETNDNR